VATPTSVTRVVPRSAAAGIRARAEELGFVPDAAPPDHAVWAGRIPTVRAVLYASGKLVLQGKDAARAAEELFGEAPAPATAAGVAVRVPTVGSDETGKGDFLGPLVVAAALVRPGQEALLAEYGVRDSKDVGDREAGEIAALLRQTLPCAVVAIDPPRYNELHREMGANLNRLLAWAHGKAIEEVLAKPGAAGAAALVVDQFAKGPLLPRALGPRARALPLEMRPRAEDHPAVAAASLLARDAFLAALRRLGGEIGVPLAKGSGPPADQAARRVVAKGGRALLERVAKMHFRNALRVGA
jgi:ribonuclease HIII